MPLSHQYPPAPGSNCDFEFYYQSSQWAFSYQPAASQIILDGTCALCFCSQCELLISPPPSVYSNQSEQRSKGPLLKALQLFR